MTTEANVVVADQLSDQWDTILGRLQALVDLEESAKASGALLRKRGVSSAANLLRLALGYGYCGLSTRDAACWARVTGCAEMSDVAVLKRIRKCDQWLGVLLGAVLASRAANPLFRGCGLRVRLADATPLSAPGSKGIDWRVHLSFDLGALCIDEVELTPASGGEHLGRYNPQPNEVLVADRGNAHRAGLWAVVEAGADFVVRLNWSNVPLQTRDGQPFDLFASLRTLEEGEIRSFSVQTAPSADAPAIPSRLVVRRRSESEAAAARKKTLKERKKKGNIDHRTLEAASYFFVLTTLSEETLSAPEVLELYRLRWQVELVFKRLKSLLALDELPASHPKTAKAFILAKLLGALLVEEGVVKAVSAFPPELERHLPLANYSVAG